MRKLNKYVITSSIAVVMLLGATYFSSDHFIGKFVKNVLVEQVQLAFKQETLLSSLSLDSSKGGISLEQLVFFNLDDPQRKQNFAAERVELEAQVSGVFSPHVRIKNARADNVDFLLEYVAPGVSNLKLVEQNYKSYLQQRKTQGKAHLLEWDLDYIELHKVRFRLVDYDGQQLADVVIPRVVLNSLSSSLSPQDNLALILQQVQLSLIQETLKGRVTGEYDLKGILHLVRRELPNRGVLSKESGELMKGAGRSIMERLLR